MGTTYGRIVLMNWKILFTLDDGLVIETVSILCDGGRTTVCVSSQVGCTMNYGSKRHMAAAEIVERAVFALRLLSSEVGSITNVVFMYTSREWESDFTMLIMPLNAADIMIHEQGLHFSHRKVTVSTSGVVPQLKCFLHESNCALAVSLNATTNELLLNPSTNTSNRMKEV